MIIKIRIHNQHQLKGNLFLLFLSLSGKKMIINNNIETRTETDQIESDNSFNELIVVLVARANYTLCLSEKLV